MKTRLFRHLLLAFTLLLLFDSSASAQFNSGSTGADGALDLSSCSVYSTCLIQLPESGILNYTTINVPPQRTVVFKRNSRNTPVTLLAQGNVTIRGRIEVSANTTGHATTIGGPGGFNGGGALQAGFGPGGGTITSNSDSPHGRWVGPLSLVPIVGGSGAADQGGGGGGAITIASSGTIVIESVDGIAGIWADGTVGIGLPGRCGSGGAIRLVANAINIPNGTLQATSCGPSPTGVIRLEGSQIDFRGFGSPAPVLAPVNPTVTLSNPPLLTIVSIGGFSVPSYAGSRFDTVDLLLPNQLVDPINVVIQAANIPSGTQVRVGFANSGSPNGISTPCNLSGGPGPLQCTATISNLNRTAVTYLLATATFAPSGSLAKFNPKGPDNVAEVRLQARLGARHTYSFFRANGSIIEYSRLPKEFLQEFGL